MSQSLYSNDDLSNLELSMQELISTIETQQRIVTSAFHEDASSLATDNDVFVGFSDTNIDHLYF